ncbi:hypothetical protein BDN70DRAFT_196577 [Pholiota conissans]|uniref:DUF7587 domain-containing protein n=1 Tax=Pholiota conissans TaxID=109636 RepID=A0A9P5ZCB0_9AGAR|nr:hypothetical protein BDN70DRAFT_196577 [Pholiota conissans]
MAATNADPDMDIAPLPQCGFGTDIDFDSLIKSNRFLFRVYTPKERSPFADDTDPFFVAPRFDELVARSPLDPPNVKFSEPVVGSYAEVARHMEWTTRTSSCYVSTSFSFTWAIWEAVRRYHIGVKKDVEIAIIDSTALGGRAATAIQLLKKSSPEERNEQFWKWYRFSQDSQSVLVYGAVPRPAVLASIPLLQILRKMPSYFLRKDIQIISGNPLDQVAWDYAKRKHNYRQFCQEMTKVFMGKSVDVRLRDSTAGAVRLALSFLRPYFHNVVQEDFDLAISYLRTFAVTISAWPGGWWVKDHPEVRQIVEVMVLSLGEELREKYSKQNREEISRLQLVIDGLEQTIKTQHSSHYVANDVEIDSDGDFEAELEESDEPTLVNRIDDAPSTPRLSLHMSIAVLPRIPISFQTPITPPESPRHSLFVPTVTVPLGNITSASQFSFVAKEEPTQNEEPHSAKSPAVSDEPASPPPTPPTRSPVFSPMKLPVIEEAEDVQELAAIGPVQVQEDETQYAYADNVAPDVTEEAKEIVEHKEEDLANSVADFTLTEGQDVEQEERSTKHEIEPSDDQTVFEHDELSSPTSPSHQWVLVGQLGSPFSSRRSSIMSVDTLCEPIEFPLKRLSFASYADSVEFVPPMPLLGGLSSRTISFSDHSPRIPFSAPPTVDLIAAVETIPLVPHVAEKVDTSLPSTASVSRTASSSSSTDSSASNDSNAAFITPLPPSPTLSVVSISSTLSRSSSSKSSVPPTPVDEDEAVAQMTLFIPPKHQISLLSPLLEQDVEDEYESIRPTRSGPSDTASYIVTGFLVGAFITLFLFSTQRRTILYLT